MVWRVSYHLLAVCFFSIAFISDLDSPRLSVMVGRDAAASAAESAFSFPVIPICEGIQLRWRSVPFEIIVWNSTWISA